MTFPLGSLGADGAAAGSLAGQASTRWRAKFALVGGGVLWLLLFLALVTHQPADPAFSTTGAGDAVNNKAGQLGAWVSDIALFLFGYSAWWLPVVGLRLWLSALARWLRTQEAPARVAVASRAAFWTGLVLLMAASCALEWTRLAIQKLKHADMPSYVRKHWEQELRHRRDRLVGKLRTRP